MSLVYFLCSVTFQMFGCHYCEDGTWIEVLYRL